MKDLGLDDRIILKCTLKKLNSSGSGHRKMSGCCEISGFVNMVTILRVTQVTSNFLSNLQTRRFSRTLFRGVNQARLVRYMNIPHGQSAVHVSYVLNRVYALERTKRH